MNPVYNNKYDILASTIQPNPQSVKYWADLASNPDGGDLKYFDGKKWVLVNNSTKDITRLDDRIDDVDGKITKLIGTAPEILDTLPEIITEIGNKVDKVTGKQLSSNDYTTAEKNKLANIDNNANNYSLPAATASKLGGIQLGFTSTAKNKYAVQLENNKAYVEINVDPETMTAYGVSWEEGSLNPVLTRVGNMDLHRSLPIQSKMRGCTLSDNGIVNHYFNSDWTKNADGSEIKLDGSDGMVMIEIPEFYTRSYVEDGVVKMMISEFPIAGYTKVNKQYISAYEATIDRTDSANLKLASVVNKTIAFRGGNNDATKDEQDNTQLGMPATNTSRANYRKYARNRAEGNSWNLYDFVAHNTVWLLYTIEYANFNCQLAFNANKTAEGFRQGGLSEGVTNVNGTKWSAFNGYYPIIPCGITDTLGNNTGVVEYTLPASFDTVTVIVKVPRYRGIENPFGHIWKNVDGIIFDIKTDADGGTSEIFISNNQEAYGDTITENYTRVGDLPRKEGYVSASVLGSFLPVAIGASSTTGRCDYFYTNVSSSSLRTCFIGGYAADGARAGLGFVNSTYAVGAAYAYYGSRLTYRK